MIVVGKCKVCEEDIVPSMKFCGKCGAPVEYVESGLEVGIGSAGGHRKQPSRQSK